MCLVMVLLNKLSSLDVCQHIKMLFKLYCIVLYLQPVLKPESYDRAQASGYPLLV